MDPGCPPYGPWLSNKGSYILPTLTHGVLLPTLTCGVLLSRAPSLPAQGWACWPACLCPPAYCCCYCLQGTTLNGALGVGVPHLYKDFGAMHKKETAARIKQWEVSV